MMTWIDELQRQYASTPQDVIVKGNTRMIKNGVTPAFLGLRLRMGSSYGDDKSTNAGAS